MGRPLFNLMIVLCSLTAELRDHTSVLVIFVGAFALDIPKIHEPVECTCRNLAQLLLSQFVGDFGGLRFLGWLPLRLDLHRTLPLLRVFPAEIFLAGPMVVVGTA